VPSSRPGRCQIERRGAGRRHRGSGTSRLGIAREGSRRPGPLNARLYAKKMWRQQQLDAAQASCRLSRRHAEAAACAGGGIGAARDARAARPRGRPARERESLARECGTSRSPIRRSPQPLYGNVSRKAGRACHLVQPGPLPPLRRYERLGHRELQGTQLADIRVGIARTSTSIRPGMPAEWNLHTLALPRGAKFRAASAGQLPRKRSRRSSSAFRSASGHERMRLWASRCGPGMSVRLTS